MYEDYNNENIVVCSLKKPNKIMGSDNREAKEKTFNTNEKIITQKIIKDSSPNDIYKTIMLKIIGVFRSFLILNHLLPESNEYKIFNPHDVCDVASYYFPYSYVGCGGCDMFNDNYAPSIETIKKFLSIYKDNHVISIINASPFSARDGGSHWMGLYIDNKRACLMCPQACDWTILKDNGSLYQTLTNNGFSTMNNAVSCQRDSCNCGVYSFLFLYAMMLCNGDMVEAVKRVGVNANNIPNSKNTKDTIFVIKNTLFGYK